MNTKNQLMKKQNLTPFEVDLLGYYEGTKKFPIVVHEGKEIPFIIFSVLIHHKQLKLMSQYIKFKNVQLSQFKDYYGLPGRSCKTCYEQLTELKSDLWTAMGLNS